ncbi:hypothetical protein [Planococcus sp. NCCP-2050]|uniref:hypothetical protein n=1 Tax=Planococcus sp. NCCP-2050 TaxID=2944679 RepID=UPI00203B66A4|nr:hypothetical protein [Planococcus sp. NCCP-2050]GKW47579.1 hypothetical protein NCCP2050_32710 [Planococcus sp. NCCP-2050]
MTRRASRWSLDNTKSGSARVDSTGIRRFGEAAFFSRTAGVAYDPENLGAGVWTIRKAKAAIQL